MPKIVDHDKKRDELLMGCFDLWARRGYGAVSMREIAQELQVSTGTLYHYFQSKEDLFVQMISWMGQRDIAKAISLIEQGRSRTEKLFLLFQFMQREESYFRRLLLLAMDYHRYHPSAQDNVLSEVIPAYRQAIQDQLDFPDDSAPIVLFSMLLGMIAQGMLDPDHVSIAIHQTFFEKWLPLLG